MPISNSCNRKVGNTLLGTLMSCAVVGCATINPVPVDQSKSEDRLKPGLHVYEARPFILVQRPFPIRVTTVLVDAAVSADGKQARLLADPSKLNLVPYLAALSADNSLPSTSISVVPSTTTAQGKPIVPPATESSASGTPAPNAGQNGTNSTDTTPPIKNPSAGTGATKSPGTSSVDYTVDKDGTAAFVVNDLFHIIYLPDYEREYVLDASSNFGIKALKVTVGPGGQLLAINNSVDNSQIVQPLLDIYTSVAKAAGTALTAAINPSAAAAAAVSKTVAQGQPITATQDLKPGSTVTLRLSKVSYAVPGIYPIIKPSEAARYDKARKDAVYPLILPEPSAYQVPFRTFDLIVAEALLAETSSILPVISQTPPANGIAACDKQVKVSQAGSVKNAIALLKTINSKVDFTFTESDFKEVDDSGCAKSITLTNVRNGTAALTSTDLKQLLDSLSELYPKTTFSINGQTGK